MNTAFVLMAQYNGMAIISLEQVCADYFTHLTPHVFQRKVLAGEIKLPITRLEPSQKSAKGIHIADLATYLDQRRQAAHRECDQLNRSSPKAGQKYTFKSVSHINMDPS
ncbi:pyocin activator PrtN family protein [Pseudomonas mosselii]|uniref:pyocin activator PrtN family protein n=1 Tax=Pseudomonas mosselii TaxID=78327 RepID=UPI000A102EEB|nr:pyocin activator PrtN family protein [Pseudomonas mosselii]ORT73142.1 Pyocin activator protein PrtN [Pseudomonas mosselii]